MHGFDTVKRLSILGDGLGALERWVATIGHPAFVETPAMAGQDDGPGRGIEFSGTLHG